MRRQPVASRGASTDSRSRAQTLAPNLNLARRQRRFRSGGGVYFLTEPPDGVDREMHAACRQQARQSRHVSAGPTQSD
jgi:hypothetical protein